MLIGELSRRTGVSPRLLRYYEEQQLLEPARDRAGYRRYGASAPARVERIRDLLEAGLSTKVIRELLPCVAEDGEGPCDRSRSLLRDGLDRIDAEMAALARRRKRLLHEVSLEGPRRV